MRTKQNLWGFIFAVPALVLFLVFAVWPILQTFLLSVYEYDLARPKRFVGLDNFVFILTDSQFFRTLGNTAIYALGTYGPVIILALLLALCLNTAIPMRNLFRVINFVPVVASWAIVAIVWKLILHQNGLLNTVLSTFGIEPVRWLLDTRSAPWATILPSIWKELGFYMVIFLAGLQTIPRTILEASYIDGASHWQTLRYITLPLLKPILFFSSVIALIEGVKVFVPQFVMTEGGPSGATEVITYRIYQTAFAFGRMGDAAAMSVILFLVVLGLTVMQRTLYGSEAG